MTMAGMDVFSGEYLAEKKVEICHKLNEFCVLEKELQNLRKDASIYVQQPNSHIFFRNDNKDKVMASCKDSIEKLKEQQKHLEEMDKPS